MPDVLTLGEALGCVRALGPVRLGGEASLHVVGAEANVAIGLARLGHDVTWVGSLGRDQVGELVLRTLRAEGVDLAHVARRDAPTGLVVFEERLPGTVRVDYHRAHSAGSRLSTDDLASALDPAPRIVHVTGLTMALSDSAADAVRAAARGGREAGALVCLDVNYRSRLWSRDDARAALAAVVGDVDVVVASDDELGLVAPHGETVAEQADALLEAGVVRVVVKHGADGATSIGADGTHTSPARDVVVVDTVGAGDAFVAGYLSAVLDGLDEPARLDRANAVGAFAVTGRGDWERLPTRDELALLTTPSGEAVR
ncbi:sugar kinase [Mumia sp. DW29H23]|uniref:sugar kinase n=1 Tax=Mumia sp. DW29H23 TaxID=3421241 RepID=UPI003D69B778